MSTILHSTQAKDSKKDTPKLPRYHDVDGFKVPCFISPETFRSAVAYKPRPDDLFIVTFPKSGTTWVQNIVACIFRDGKPFTSGLEFFTQTPFLELTGAEAAETMTRPGAIKLHLPFHLTPWSSKAKYIFVARNPKDCCVSYYHHTRKFSAYHFEEGKFDDYFELFVEGKTGFGDYFDTLLSWYEHRSDPNVLFITYEQLKKHTRTYVLKIAEFIDPKYKETLENNEMILKDVIHHSSFQFLKEHLNKYFKEMHTELKNMPKDVAAKNPDLPLGLKNLVATDMSLFNDDPSEVTFIRKGIVGDWKNHFSPTQNARLEKKFQERTVGTDIPDLWKDDM